MSERVEGAGAAGVSATIEFEVWRTHLKGGADVRICRCPDEKSGRQELDLCLADKAAAYPAARLDFYLVRATTTRERITQPTAAPSAAGGADGGAA